MSLPSTRVDRATVEHLAAAQGPASSAAIALGMADDMEEPVFYLTPQGVGVYDISKETKR